MTVASSYQSFGAPEDTCAGALEARSNSHFSAGENPAAQHSKFSPGKSGRLGLPFRSDCLERHGRKEKTRVIDSPFCGFPLQLPFAAQLRSRSSLRSILLSSSASRKSVSRAPFRVHRGALAEACLQRFVEAGLEPRVAQGGCLFSFRSILCFAPPTTHLSRRAFPPCEEVRRF